MCILYFYKDLELYTILINSYKYIIYILVADQQKPQIRTLI